jgi:hypothetical protein
MGLKIGENMHLMDIHGNAPIAPQKNCKHNIFIYVWNIYFAGHEFGVFTKLPK